MQPSLVFRYYRDLLFFNVSRGRRSEHEVARPPNEVYYLIKHTEEGVEPAGNVPKLNVHLRFRRLQFGSFKKSTVHLDNTNSCFGVFTGLWSEH